MSGGEAPGAARIQAKSALDSLPVRFEANQGQWNPGIRFRARAGEYSVMLGERAAVVAVASRRIEMALAGSRRPSAIYGFQPFPWRVNFFLGNDSNRWRSGVSQYGRVRYQAVYSGIDLDYYGNQRSLEYDFRVHPGGDPGAIRIRFAGMDRLSLTDAGDLLVEAGGRTVVQKKPVIYQEEAAGRQPVRGAYRLLGRGLVGIQVAAYDRSRDLVIDPVLMYSSLLGGTGEDSVTAVQVDSQGFIYAAGFTTATDLAATGGAFQGTSGGTTDAFLAKIDPHASGAGSLVYLTYFGGTGNDMVNAMTLGPGGFVYLAGATTSTDFPVAGPPQQANNAGGTDAFVTKIQPAGQGNSDLWYSTYLGGGDVDVANGIAADSAGRMYVIGTTKSTDFPLTASAYAAQLWGAQDAFIAEIDPSGSPSLQYSTYLGGETDDDGRAIAVKDATAVYVAGSTFSQQFPQAGAQYRGTLQGGLDIWVAKMDLTQSVTSSLVYSTYFGGSDTEEVRAMALDGQGRLVLTGYTLSTDFPTTPDALRASLGGAPNAFVTRLDLNAPRGQVVNYSTYLGGSMADVGLAVATDTAGNIYVTGYTFSKDFPVTPDALQPAYGGGIDVFATKLSASGQLDYSTYLGLTGIHLGRAIAAGGDGTMYVGGSTGITNIGTTGGGAQTSFAGGNSDGFVLAISPN